MKWASLIRAQLLGRNRACRALSVFVIGALISAPFSAQAEPMKDFVVSCSYGVLAGTLVGAATLAFSDKPGDNLNKVARGASLGLYAGILLGAYVVYGGPSEDEDAAAQLNRTSIDDFGDGFGGDFRIHPRIAAQKSREIALQPPRVLIVPVVSERGFEGAAAEFRVVSF